MLDLLREVALPDPERILASYPHQLSGGQRQRIMIAMALALEPALLIADEPTTALDVTTQAQILKLIVELQKRHGMGVLFITHDFGVVAEIAHRVAVLREGRLVELGAKLEVLQRPRHEYTRMLIRSVPTLEPHDRAGERRLRRWCCETKKLSKTYVDRGWLGAPARGARRERRQPRGAQGPDPRHRGRVGLGQVDGGALHRAADRAERRRDPARRTWTSRAAARARCGRFAAACRSCSRIRTARSTRAAASARRSSRARSTTACRAREALERARRLLELVRMDPAALERYPHQFSGGQRQRICIARALAMEPELLVADEAVSALDVSVQAQVLALLAEIRSRLDLAMLFITHDLRVAAQVCDQVAVMQQGRVVEYGPAREVFLAPRTSTRARCSPPRRGGASRLAAKLAAWTELDAAAIASRA